MIAHSFTCGSSANQIFIFELLRYSFIVLLLSNTFSMFNYQLSEHSQVISLKTQVTSLMTQVTRLKLQVCLYSLGMGFSTECTPCKPGFYSSIGSSHCTRCGANTYAPLSRSG